MKEDLPSDKQDLKFGQMDMMSLNGFGINFDKLILKGAKVDKLNTEKVLKEKLLDKIREDDLNLSIIRNRDIIPEQQIFLDIIDTKNENLLFEKRDSNSFQEMNWMTDFRNNNIYSVAPDELNLEILQSQFFEYRKNQIAQKYRMDNSHFKNYLKIMKQQKHKINYVSHEKVN